MLLITHILIALASVAYSTYMIFVPSYTKLRVSYGMIAATIGTGTYLVYTTRSPLLQSCLTGLAYISVVSVGVALTHYRLAHAKIDN